MPHAAEAARIFTLTRRLLRFYFSRCTTKLAQSDNEDERIDDVGGCAYDAKVLKQYERVDEEGAGQHAENGSEEEEETASRDEIENAEGIKEDGNIEKNT